MEDLVHQENSLVLFLLKQTQKFVWAYMMMLIIVIYLLVEKKYLNLKPTIKKVGLPTQFCLGSISNGFSATESRKVSLNGNVYDFSVDYNSIDKIWHIKHSQVFNDQK